MNSIRFLLIALSALCPILSYASREKDCALSADVEQLLKYKGKYDQRVVCVTGRLCVQFENNQLSLGASKVWLQFFRGPEYTEESVERDGKQMKEWKRLYQSQCVVVRGRFTLKNTGHFGMYPAGIEEIESITKAPPAACGPHTP